MKVLRELACAAGLLATVPAHAQFAGDLPTNAVLPATGFTSPAGGLREQLDRQPPGGGPSLQPGIVVTPSIGVDVGATDNASGVDGNAPGNNNSGADGLVIVTPGVQVSGESSRVRVNAGYFPSITRYFRTGSQNATYQDGYGSANITVVPDAVFVSSTANVSVQSRTGGTFYNDASSSNLSTSNLNRNDQATTYNVSVTPYAVHRFGSAGTAQVGYTFAYTDANGQSGTFGDGQSVFNNQSYNGRFAQTQGLVTNREFASFTTGEDLGRLNSVTAVQATQFSGSGVYSSASRNNITDDLSYALNRFVALIGRIGYENVRYSGFPPTRIDDIIWRAGVRVTPNANSQIVLAYGHSDGIDSAFVTGFYTPTARTRIDVSYSSGLTTDLEDIQNTGIISQYDSAGTSYNQFTNGPVSSSSGFFGIDNNLFRLRRFSATGTLLYDRDTYSATVSNEQRTIVAAATPGQTSLLGSSDDGTTATLTWEHQLSPVLTSSVSGSFGTDTISGAGGGSQTTYGAFAGLFYQLSPTITTSARYNFLKRTGNDTSLSSAAFNNGYTSRAGTVNTLLLGLRKSF